MSGRGWGKIAQPYFFHMRDESLFAFAGIWDEWQGDGKVIASCAIITTTALIPFKRQKPILDEFVDRLRMNPGASGFIIAYGRWALAREALKYLTETHGLETAPRKGKFTVKFFLVPAGAVRPN